MRCHTQERSADCGSGTIELESINKEPRTILDKLEHTA